jgi:mannonate dehydratase
MKKEPGNDREKEHHSLRRREFLKASLGAGAAGVFVNAPSGKGSNVRPQGPDASRIIDEYDPSNIKIERELNPKSMTDDDLLFLKQIGVRWARFQFGAEDVPIEFIRGAQERCARFGIQVYSGVHGSYRTDAIQLGLPGRDKDIETYCRFIRSLGQLGIPVAGHDFHPGNTYSTGTVEHRGYKTREFDLNVYRSKMEKQAYDREYTAEEFWANYTYFLRAVLPVAKEANVKLALHPDDPPIARMNGVTRIFNSYEGFRRAEQIAASPHWGLLFCVGTWSEGGEGMGKSVVEAIMDFGSRGKIFEVHFRNVSAPLPRFVETFPDDGYMDMYRVMKALREVRFNGGLGADHIPALAGDENRRAGTAYCIACIRSLLRRANEEVG